MDFKAVLSHLIASFEENRVRYALIGGFALGLWGVGRSTVDIDFLVNRDDIDKVDVVMTGLGYECRYATENVSQYISPLRVMGEVDFLHAFREASLDMLTRAEEKGVFSGEIKVRTLRPEDLIGLKLQAIKNNPGREDTDLADMKMLIQAHKDNLDWTLIEHYGEILQMQDVCRKLRKGSLS